MGSMKRLLLPFVAVGLAICGLGAARPVQLLTATEAAQPDGPRSSGPGRSAIDGLQKPETVVGAPQILVDTPESGGEVSAPFPVKIRFVPSAGAKINVSTVRIEVLKLVPISLLARVKPYLTAAGINVPEAKIPAGTYNVRVAVADDQGREGTTVQTWVVH